MMRPIMYALLTLLGVVGCDNGNPQTEPNPWEFVTKTIRPSVETQLGVAHEVQKNLERGRLKRENVTILKSNPPQYKVRGPRVIVEKLARLASGEWRFVMLQPNTNEARSSVKLHIHKFTSSGDLQEEDVEELMPGAIWRVIGPEEIIERLQKVATPE